VVRTSAATRTARRSLLEEGTPRPAREQAGEEDDGRDYVVDGYPRGQVDQPTVRAQDEPEQTVRKKEDCRRDSHYPGPPSAQEKSRADQQLETNGDHGLPKQRSELRHGDPVGQDESCPTDQENRRSVYVPGNHGSAPQRAADT